MGVLDDLFNLGNGIRSAVQDVPSLLKNIVTLNPHGAVTDGRKIVGDVGDVLKGVGHLGVDLGKVPEKYLGTAGKMADSPILSAAQLVIEGEKALCGSGEPADGKGYSDSADKLWETFEHLYEKSRVIPDLWSGAAADAYAATAATHQSLVFDMSPADQTIADRLNIEAGQVSRARKTLDDTSQYLYDYGLATAWMALVPGLNVAKIMADMAAASAALATTHTTMLVLANNVSDNARDINAARKYHDAAAQDTSGAETLGAFVDPKDDQLGNLPPRMQPGTKYHYPIGLPPPPPIPAKPLGLPGR